jgi:hypothetical protein
MHLLDQRLDHIRPVLAILVGFVFDDGDVLLGFAHPVGDRCLGLRDGPGDILVPSDGLDEVVLQPGQFIDDVAEFPLGRVSPATLPDTAVEDLGLLMLETFQRTCQLLQGPGQFLRPVVQFLLIGLHPSAGVEHLVRVFTGRFRDSHRLAPYRLAGLADRTIAEGGRLI